MSRRATISYALVLAISSCLFLIFIPPLGFLLTLGWAAVVGYGFVKYGGRGWPTLSGAPPVIWGLRLFYAIYFEGGP